MPINTSHKAVISLEIELFFNEVPRTSEHLTIFIGDFLEALQHHKKNYFFRLANLLKEPQNFYQLEIMGNLTKGEVREYIIEDISDRVIKAARNAGTTIDNLGWDKESILVEIRKMEDHDTNLICQKTDVPEGFNPETFEEKIRGSANTVFIREIAKNIQFENKSKELTTVTLDELSVISKKLAIIDPHYIFPLIDSVKKDITDNIFEDSVLKKIEESLPNEYKILKSYFNQLHQVIGYDMNEVFDYFYGHKLPCVALALSLAIAEKEHLDPLKENVLNVVYQVQLQNPLKDAFISHVLMDSKQLADQQERATKKERMAQISFFKVNNHKVSSVLKCIEKGYSLTESGVGKVIFENLTFGELQAVSGRLNALDKSDTQNTSEIKILIQNRINHMKQEMEQGENLSNN